MREITYQLLGLRLRNVVDKPLGRVKAGEVVEVVKEVFSLDYFIRSQHDEAI